MIVLIVDIRHISVGCVHAEPGEPEKVVRYTKWLRDHPDEEMDPIEVTYKLNGTFRIWNGRHRFLSYVLAERPHIPIVPKNA